MSKNVKVGSFLIMNLPPVQLARMRFSNRVLFEKPLFRKWHSLAM